MDQRLKKLRTEHQNLANRVGLVFTGRQQKYKVDSLKSLHNDVCSWLDQASKVSLILCSSGWHSSLLVGCRCFSYRGVCYSLADWGTHAPTSE
jgi:hypothetical protein